MKVRRREPSILLPTPHVSPDCSVCWKSQIIYMEGCRIPWRGKFYRPNSIARYAITPGNVYYFVQSKNSFFLSPTFFILHVSLSFRPMAERCVDIKIHKTWGKIYPRANTLHVMDSTEYPRRTPSGLSGNSLADTTCPCIKKAQLHLRVRAPVPQWRRPDKC